MKYISKALSILLIVVLVCSLSGCANKEVKHVIELIDSIGEVTVTSKLPIDEATKAYNSLSPKDKNKVKNIDVLYKAQEEFEKFVPEYISDQVTLFRQCKNPEFFGIKEFVDEYYDKLTVEQIETIGCAIGKAKIEELAIEVVKDSMKNPNSFELIEFNLDDVIKGSEDTYYALLEVSFRGTNSFGGIVPDNWSGAIHFKVDFDDCTISYIKSISY